MSDRLREIAERERKARPGERVKQPGGKVITTYTMKMPNLKDAEAFYGHAADDCRWLVQNITNAVAYCDRILAHNPNGAQLMFLTEVKRILTGESDGRTIAEGTDGR